MREFLAVTVAAGCLAGVAAAQTSPCDPWIKPPEGDPHGYHLRGDRCEGTYIRAVAGSGIFQIAGFTAAFPSYDSKGGQALGADWTPAGNAAVHLRATSLRHRLYYRMDAVRPAGSSSYLWPTDVLSFFGLKGDEIGVAAWTTLQVGAVQRDVYLPLSITPGAESAHAVAEASTRYRLAIVPAMQLSQVYVSLATVTGDGAVGDFLRKDEPLDYGYYPADREVPIDITGLVTSGVYYVEIGATLMRGGSSTTRLWFHHAARPESHG